MSAAATVPRAVKGAIPSLDGIRAIAVLLVFVAHAGLEKVVPGGLGVTIFFVLSGFLITTLMRIEHQRTGKLDYQAFYQRRLLRLMPPLVIVVAVTSLLAHTSIIGGGYTVGGLLAALFYFGNYFVIATDFHGMPDGIGVIWSLAIEEHYYLVFPPVAALLLARHRPAQSAALLGLLCALVLGWRLYLSFQGASSAYLSMATDTRVDAILVGCLLALWRNPWLDPVSTPRVGREAALAAACVCVLVGTLVYRNELFRYTARYTLQSLAMAPLLWLAVARAGYAPFRWLSTRPMVYIGSISYTVYLTHHVIMLALARHWPQLGQVAVAILAAAATLAVAEPMRRWVEAPCAALRRKLHRSSLARPSKAGVPALSLH